MILPAGQTKGKIQSNGGQAKEESKKVERIVPIILNGREEGRSRSRERAPNPFLSGSKAGSEPGLKSKQEKEKISNGASSSPTKIAPLATAEVFHVFSDCSHTTCFKTSMKKAIVFSSVTKL